MPARSPTASPYTSLEALMSGSIARGIPSRLRISSSQSSVSRFMSSVRLAFVTSVTWTPPLAPPVSCQIHHVSMFPNRSSPASARSRVPSTLSRIHLIFVPDPAGLRVDLLVLFLVDGDHLAAVVEDHEARARRSLIERGCVVRHSPLSFLRRRCAAKRFRGRLQQQVG